MHGNFNSLEDGELRDLEKELQRTKTNKELLKSVLVDKLGFHLVIKVNNLEWNQYSPKARLETITRLVEVSVDVRRDGPNSHSLYPIPPNIRSETQFKFRFFDNNFEEILTDQNYQAKLTKRNQNTSNQTSKLSFLNQKPSKKPANPTQTKTLSQLAVQYFQEIGESRYGMLLFIQHALPSDQKPYFSYLLENCSLELSVLPTLTVTQALDQYNFANISKNHENDSQVSSVNHLSELEI